MSFKLSERAGRVGLPAGTPNSAKSVYGTLCSYANSKTNACTVAIDRIAAAANVGRSTAQRSLDRLETMGAIGTARGNQHRPDTYTVNVAWLDARQRAFEAELKLARQVKVTPLDDSQTGHGDTSEASQTGHGDTSEEIQTGHFGNPDRSNWEFQTGHGDTRNRESETQRGNRERENPPKPPFGGISEGADNWQPSATERERLRVAAPGQVLTDQRLDSRLAEFRVNVRAKHYVFASPEERMAVAVSFMAMTFQERTGPKAKRREKDDGNWGRGSL